MFPWPVTWTFMPWILDYLDQPRYGSEPHTQPYTSIDTQAETVYQETFCVFIYGEKVYIQMYFMQI